MLSQTTLFDFKLHFSKLQHQAITNHQSLVFQGQIETTKDGEASPEVYGVVVLRDLPKLAQLVPLNSQQPSFQSEDGNVNGVSLLSDLSLPTFMLRQVHEQRTLFRSSSDSSGSQVSVANKNDKNSDMSLQYSPTTDVPTLSPRHSALSGDESALDSQSSFEGGDPFANRNTIKSLLVQSNRLNKDRKSIYSDFGPNRDSSKNNSTNSTNDGNNNNNDNNNSNNDNTGSRSSIEQAEYATLLGAMQDPKTTSTFVKQTQREQAFNEKIPNRFLIKSDELLMLQIIGNGEFGIVSLANFHNSLVVVKTLKQSNPKLASDFEDEGLTMCSLPPHPHVVRFIGICLKPMMIVIEFAENGSLSAYLTSPMEINAEQKVKWMKEIASGMCHLHQQLVLHCDLAARNVLLSASLTAKLCDFGMSKYFTHVINPHPNSAKQQTMLPIKWLAPESIALNHFSPFSDVWSYSCVLYEILNRTIPWPTSSAIQVARDVANGVSLEIPSSADVIIADLMRSCFSYNPLKRPTFESIVKMLTKAYPE